MKKTILPLILLCLLVEYSATAQYHLQFIFRGKTYETNASGKIEARPLTEQTIMKEIGQRIGVTDISGWKMVYHIGGHELGDTIEIVDAQTGRTLDTIFGLYFGEAIGRVALKDGTGTEEKRIDYIYTRQNSHSMGAANVTKRRLSVNSGVPRTFVMGTMTYVWAAEGSTGVRFCTGSFRTGKALTFTSP